MSQFNGLRGHARVGPEESMLRNRTLLAVSFVIFAAYTGFGIIGPVRLLYARS